MRRAPGIHELRPSRAIDQELEWYFNSVESDLGLRSNFLASIGVYAAGSPPPAPDEAVDASHAQRIIRRCLGTLEEPHEAVLRTAYTQRDWPVALWDLFGRLTGIVVRLACAHEPVPEGQRAQDRFEMNHATWLARESERARLDPMFLRLRLQAQARLACAATAYGRARGNVLSLHGRRPR